ncbi:MAG TPA: LytTR family DNA-binding domain-containing protein [Thermoanaerobaculia bacterium]|nr:LytTR family DNA-binding domain-containing protein [Thermoanaerobaculia bacterium]
MARQTLRAVLVDDEQLALRRLERLVDGTGRLRVVNRFTDPEEAEAFLRRETVDVVFLDIEMPGMNGFELLARLPEPPLVIFTTAYDQYALRAFEVNSIDYLLKPIERRHLDRAVAKLERQHVMPQPEWRALAQMLAFAAPGFPRRVMSRLGDRTQLIDLAAVTHFIAAEKVTYAVAAARRQIVDYSLAELEQRLDPQQFLRIHRSIVVNLTFVEEIEQHAGGPARVRLRDGQRTQLPIARERLRELKDRLVF